MQEPLRDNPNPNAKIAILLPPHIFFLNAFKTVLEHLPNAEYVPDFSMVVRRETYPDSYKTVLRQKLCDEGVFWRDPEFSDLSSAGFCSKYSLLAAPFYGGLLEDPSNKDKLKARIFYGNAKDAWGYSLRNAHFDLICCPGPYAYEHLSLYASYSAKIVPIGEPKLDRFFKADKEKETILRELRIRLDPNKETLVYLPTWGSLSSISITVPALAALADRYNVVVKIHHMTMLYDSFDLAYVRDTALVKIDDTADITDALQLADVVISDNSGAIFDALAAGKPLILIDPIEEPGSFFGDKPFHGFWNKRPGGSATRKYSIEQVIKRGANQVAPVVTVRAGSATVEPEDIEKALTQTGTATYRARQRSLVANVYAYRDGNAGKRAAEEITMLLRDGTSRNRELERLVDESEQRIKATIKSQLEFKYQQELARLEMIGKIKDLPFLQKLRTLHWILGEYF